MQRLCQHWKQPNGIHWYHFHLQISHKAAKSMAKLISQSCGELQLAVCFSRGDGAIWRPLKHSWTSDKPQKQNQSKNSLGNFQYQYLPKLLVNVYSYCLMVKSVLLYAWKQAFLKSGHIYIVIQLIMDWRIYQIVYSKRLCFSNILKKNYWCGEGIWLPY